MVGPELTEIVERRGASAARPLAVAGWLGVVLLVAAAVTATAGARAYPVGALGRIALVTGALGWALALALALAGGRPYAGPLPLLRAGLTLPPIFNRFSAPP